MRPQHANTGNDQSNGKSNPFAPPRSKVDSPVEAKRRNGKLLPYQKAGRVIRLMSLLSLIGVAGISVAILLPAIASRQSPPFWLFLASAAMLALVAGLFFVGTAAMRHEPWARVIGIIYGLLLLVGFPIGTLIGVYVLWQLVFGWGDGEIEAEPLR